MEKYVRNFLVLGLIIACVPMAEAKPKANSALQNTTTKKKKSTCKHRKKHKRATKKSSSRMKHVKAKIKSGLQTTALVVTAPVWLPIALISLKNHKGSLGTLSG